MKLFNTLSGQLETFEPIHPGEVRMYTCGPTVYDVAHIGNFRTFIFEDLLRRTFEFLGYKVGHTMNITDVDDKTIAGAARDMKSLADFTEHFIQLFMEDLQTLHVLKPNVPAELPRATREIPAMLELIQTLMKNGTAYEREGSVYYRIAQFPAYGRLSKKDLAMNREGARVDVDEYDKETGADFVLWKASRPGEPSWPSPWGDGRPGWHLECSAMSMKYLGETFDIHAGGEDLVFPHHENEIAQSEAATGKPFVKYWLHCKFLLVDGEKMSKSKGNFYTLRDLLARKYDPRVIRYALLSVHYRTPLNFTLGGLEASAKALVTLRAFYSSVLNHEIFGRGFAESDGHASSIREAQTQFQEALEDDLNISRALAVLFNFADRMDSLLKQGLISRSSWALLRGFLAKVNGVLEVLPDESYSAFSKEAVHLFERRKEARSQKQFEASDQLRKQIEALGYFVWDEPRGLSGMAK